MSPRDLWHVAGFIVLAMLFAWAIVERRKTRRAIESHGGDGTDRAMLGQRMVYLRAPAAGAQGASAAPAAVQPAQLAAVEPVERSMFPPPEPRSNPPAGAPAPTSGQAPELRRAGLPTSAPELRGSRAACVVSQALPRRLAHTSPRRGWAPFSGSAVDRLS
jgi:hypothetical protein